MANSTLNFTNIACAGANLIHNAALKLGELRPIIKESNIAQWYLAKILTSSFQCLSGINEILPLEENIHLKVFLQPLNEQRFLYWHRLFSERRNCIFMKIGR